MIRHGFQKDAGIELMGSVEFRAVPYKVRVQGGGFKGSGLR